MIKYHFLKNNEKFPGRDYDKLIKGLNNIIDENEYDDSAADTFNNLIAKFLYTSAYSKFDSNFFDTTIKKLLQDIGYTSLNLKPGDDINSYKLYFERANKVEEDGISNTIKKIFLQPMIIIFTDEENKSKEYKLLGICSFYK